MPPGSTVELLINPHLSATATRPDDRRPTVPEATEVLPGWWLYPGSHGSAQAPGVSARRGYVRLIGGRGTRLLQPLVSPASDVRFTARIRVVSGAVLAGVTMQTAGPPPVLIEAPDDGNLETAWREVTLGSTNAIDEAVIYCARDDTMADIQWTSLTSTAAAVADPTELPVMRAEAVRPQAVLRPDAFDPGKPGSPGSGLSHGDEFGGVSVTLTGFSGGSGEEPGATFHVNGTYSLIEATLKDITVLCDGNAFPATAADDGTFIATVRAYRSGSLPMQATATAVSTKQTSNPGSVVTDGWPQKGTPTMPVTLARSTPSISATGPAEVKLNEGQPTFVPISATTSDSNTFGGHVLSALPISSIALALGDLALAPTAVDDSRPWVPLSPVNGLTTTFHGFVALSDLPLGERGVLIRVRCADALGTIGYTTVTVTGNDQTPPRIAISYPHVGETTPLTSLAVTIPVAGTVTDGQSTVVSVTWSLDPSDPSPPAATITTPAGATSGTVAWSAPVTVPDYGDHPLFIWAKDGSGNQGETSIDIRVRPEYKATDVGDRLSERWYLSDLINVAIDGSDGQLVTKPVAGVPNRPTAAELVAVLKQPVDRLALPQNGVAAAIGMLPINELRVPVEVLSAHLSTASIAMPDDQPYRDTAYASLLTNLGASYAQLRLARASSDVIRNQLAEQIGVQLNGPTGPGSRPDQLDRLTLDGDALTQEALQDLFGLAATNRADPLEVLNPPQILIWQQTAARSRWLGLDAAPPIALGYRVLVDPDLLTESECLDGGIRDLRATRLKTLTDLNTGLAALHAHGIAEPDAFASMIALGLPGTSLTRLITDQGNGIDISGELAAAGLDLGGFACLQNLQRLTQLADAAITDQEWSDIQDVLVAALRRRSYTTWRAEEIAASVVLGPDSFVIQDGPPPLGHYRADPAARADWERTLQFRTAEAQSRVDDAASRVAAAERAALPILRDSLLAAIAGADGDPSATGDALTRRYQLDLLASGALTTTRVSVATVSLQLLYRAIRARDVVSDSPAAAWLIAGGPFSDTTGFDGMVWPIMSSYGSWRAATTTYLFPELFLDPAQYPQKLATAAYATLVSGLGAGGITRPGALSPVNGSSILSSWEAYAQQWLRSEFPLQPNLVFSYRSTDQAHQRDLAQLCSDVLTAVSSPGNADTVREVFWCAPMLIAGMLTDEGQYEDALAWYSLVLPYTDQTTTSIYSVVTAELTSPLAVPHLGQNVWAIPAFGQPEPSDAFRETHGASARTAPHLRATVLAILSCLIRYADAQFTAGTEQSVGLALQLYLDAQALSRHPCLEPQQPDDSESPPLAIPTLPQFRLTISAQLAKLRQGRNIAGQLIPSITPSEPVIAQPTPYPYKVLLSRAQQLVTQAVQIESQYQSALSNLDLQKQKSQDADDALALANQQVTIQQDQADAAARSVDVAQAQLVKAHGTIADLHKAINSNAQGNDYERKMLSDFQVIRGLQNGLSAVSSVIGIAQAAATVDAGKLVLSGFSAGISVGTEIGGYVVQGVLQTSLNNAQQGLQANQLMASVENRLQEWNLQLSSATADQAVALDQSALAKAQQQTAADEVTAAQLKATQASQALAALAGLNLNVAMYRWLVDVLGDVYRFFLQQATATARLAQAQLAFERAERERAFIRSDYWQPPSALAANTPADTRGLAGAELLSQDVTRLDGYAFSSDQRRLNISQTFSLLQLFPVEFMDFRRTGEISIATPMALFDLDFPGDVGRLIRQVRVSIVALVPPNRGIRARLSNNGLSRVTTATQTGWTDVILRREPATVALTSPISDSGVFGTVDLQPQLLLPFEGSGVDTTWQLSLPAAANPIDYGSISDVLLTVDYTAVSDETNRTLVVRQLNANRTRGGDVVLSLATDYPDAWYQLTNPAPTTPDGGDGDTHPETIVRSVTISAGASQFPSGLTDLAITAIVAHLPSYRTGDLTPAAISLTFNGLARTASTDGTGLASTRSGAGAWKELFGSPISPIGDWVIGLSATAAGLLDAGTVTDVLLDITWSATGPAWPS